MAWNAEELRERFKIPSLKEVLASGEYDELVNATRNGHRLMVTPRMHLKVSSTPPGEVNGDSLTEENVDKPVVHFLPNDHPEIKGMIERWVNWPGAIPEKSLELPVIRYLLKEGRLTPEQERALKEKGIEL